MNNIIQEYRPILVTLYFLGVFPDAICQHDHLLRPSNTFYSMAFHFITFTTVLTLFFFRLVHELELLHLIEAAANAGLNFCHLAGYFAAAYFLFQNHSKHAAFFNGIVRFDQNRALKPKSIQKRSITICLILVVFITVHTSTIFLVQRKDFLIDIIFDYFVVVLMNIMYLMMLHIRFCAELLTDRFQAIREQFESFELKIATRTIKQHSKIRLELHRTFDDFRRLWKLRSKFQQIFSQVIFITMLNEQQHMAYCLFMMMLLLNDHFMWQVILPFTTFFLLPAVRKVVLVRTLGRLTKKVRAHILF